jgi:hypothetical protein
LALQISTCPDVGRQDLGFAPPGTIVVSMTVDCDQSDEAVTSMPSHSPLTLSPSLRVNGLAVRAQWYPPQEWFAEAETESMTAAKAASPTSGTSFFNIATPGSMWIQPNENVGAHSRCRRLL